MNTYIIKYSITTFIALILFFASNTVYANEDQIESSMQLCLEQYQQNKISKKDYKKCYEDQYEKLKMQYKKYPSLISSLWRNAVFPGWGQFHDKNSSRGWIYSYLYAVTLISGNVLYSDEQRRYQGTQETRNKYLFFVIEPRNGILAYQLFILPKETEMNKSKKNQTLIKNATIGSALIILSSSMIDSILTRKNHSDKTAESAGMDYQMEIMPEYVGFSIKVGF